MLHSQQIPIYALLASYITLTYTHTTAYTDMYIHIYYAHTFVPTVHTYTCTSTFTYMHNIHIIHFYTYILCIYTQVKALVEAMKKETVQKGNDLFTRSDLNSLCNRLNLPKDPDTLIEILRTECYLLLKGSNLYKLQV